MRALFPKILLFCYLGLGSVSAAEPIEIIWLTHASETPDTIVVSWETDEPGPSVVEYGTGESLGSVARSDKATTLHHVEIPLGDRGATYFYRIRSGSAVSEIHSFRSVPHGKPGDELRVAIVGNLSGGTMNLDAILADRPHLLVSGGDNVTDLHRDDQKGTQAFSALIERNSHLFQTTPFMPILGNHDRQIAPRGPRPPDQPAYDISATAFREFFALPGDEWKWAFTIPEFGVEFVALDLNHITDFGNTWQTCHAWQADSEQFRWYIERMRSSTSPFVFTLMNEKHGTLIGRERAWHEHFLRGSALISGFGHYGERAMLEGGLPYFNTSLKGDGNLYLDSRSQFHTREDHYLLLSIESGSREVTAEFKSLDGELLEKTIIPLRVDRE